MILKAKKLFNLDLDEVIDIHIVSGEAKCEDFDVLSTVKAAQETMLSSSVNYRTKIFAPSLCAFAILDQLGSCYELHSKPPGNGSPIQKALRSLCGLSLTQDQIEALYAFRNGLAHDACFTSKLNSTQQWYRFQYSVDSPDIVSLPTRHWDGTLADISNDTTTFVNQRRLLNAVTAGVRLLGQIFQGNRSEIKVLQSRDDILQKYLVWLAPDRSA